LSICFRKIAVRSTVCAGKSLTGLGVLANLRLP
jgi:hypothetical protein